MIIIPSENFHMARVKDPGQYDKIVTKDLGDGVQMLIGYKKGDDGKETSEPTSYHFKKEDWTPKQVKKYLKDHDVKTIELEMATKEDDAKSNSSPEGSKSDGTSGLGSTPEMKENGIIVTAKGDIIPEQIPIDRVPDKTFGNVRQSDIPELIDRAVKVEVKNLLPVGHPDVDLEEELTEQEGSPVIDVTEVPEDIPELEEVSSEEMPSGLDSESWDANAAKSDFMDWARSEDGNVSKRSLMKWFLDVDAGDGQSESSYRYPVGAIVNGEPHYCHKAMDHSWNLASGKETGVANRNIQKKIVFLKNREGMPLTEDQMDFTERHMSAEKENPDNFVEHNGIPGGFDLVAQADMKLNSSIAGSKVIYEDDSVIDVPVVPMREGVFTGTDGIPTLKKFEYFGKDAHWLEGQPILKGHTSPTEFVTYKHNRIGKLMNVTARPDKKDVVAVARYYKEKLTPEDMSRIKSGNPYDGSIAYTTHTSFVNGDYSGHKYNAVEDGGYHFYHFAELANGTGACSTKDGCGFMLNEDKSSKPDVKLNESDNMTNIYYNDLRRAEISQPTDNEFSIKLNSVTGGNGTLQATDLDTAKEWSRIYVKSGKIPVSMKLNYNCPDSEKSGSGKGSCGGSKSLKEVMDKDKKAKEKTEIVHLRSGGSKSLQEAMDKSQSNKFSKYAEKNANKSLSDSSMSKQKASEVLSQPKEKLDKYLEQWAQNEWTENFLPSHPDIDGTDEEEKQFLSAFKTGLLSTLQKKAGKSSKQNSQFKQLQNNTGNTMTEEEFIAPETDVSETVQKLNADFEQKLNERDAKIAELETQLGDLVQKQNAAEEALVAERAKQDFESFTLKLNAKARVDAQDHYEGFKSEGWSYFDGKNLLNVEVPKMNARGVGAGEGDNASGLQAARDMFKKAQKERFSKRV